MRIAVAITHEYPLQVPKGKIYASIPIHFQVAEGLARKGHEVTLFCSEDTQINLPLKKYSIGFDSAWKKRKDHPKKFFGSSYAQAADQLMLATMYELGNKGEYDLIWHNNPLLSATYSPFAKLPSLYTLHDPLTEAYALLRRYAKYPNHWFVGISNAQRSKLPDLRYVGTVYNGIDVGLIPFCDQSEDYYVFFGRIMPEKGVAESIEVAKRAGVRLKIIGCLATEVPSRVAYWEELQKEIDGDQIQYLGCLLPEELLPIVSKARGFINMVDIHESFGMVLVESLACGTPVLARRRGAIPEVLKDGVTGCIVGSIEEAVERLPELDQIDRQACRAYVEDNFSIARCIEEYDLVMRKAVSLYHEPA